MEPERIKELGEGLSCEADEADEVLLEKPCRIPV
jgi:hypothetical protein